MNFPAALGVCPGLVLVQLTVMSEISENTWIHATGGFTFCFDKVYLLAPRTVPGTQGLCIQAAVTSIFEDFYYSVECVDFLVTVSAWK